MDEFLKEMGKRFYQREQYYKQLEKEMTMSKKKKKPYNEVIGLLKRLRELNVIGPHAHSDLLSINDKLYKEDE